MPVSRVSRVCLHCTLSVSAGRPQAFARQLRAEAGKSQAEEAVTRNEQARSQRFAGSAPQSRRNEFCGRKAADVRRVHALGRRRRARAAGAKERRAVADRPCGRPDAVLRRRACLFARRDARALGSCLHPARLRLIWLCWQPEGVRWAEEAEAGGLEDVGGPEEPGGCGFLRELERLLSQERLVQEGDPRRRRASSLDAKCCCKFQVRVFGGNPKRRLAGQYNDMSSQECIMRSEFCKGFELTVACL